VAIERNFFGQIEIAENRDRSVRSMRHGTTLHGLQLLAPELERMPTAYFHRGGPLGDVFETLDSRTARGPGAVGIVGLGTGTIACLVPSRHVVFFEIDPAVVRFARNPEYFRFLHLCTPKAEVVLGDARLSLARSPDARFATLIVDAFSSDAVPVHLLTREAFELYRRKLVPGGALVFHLSSRHLELRQVVGSQAAALGWQGVWRLQSKVPNPGVEYPSEWAFLSARRELVTDLAARHPDWQPLPSPTRRSSWTDDFSNVISLLR
jgi:SAM-dependent methyltransferase